MREMTRMKVYAAGLSTMAERNPRTAMREAAWRVSERKTAYGTAYGTARQTGLGKPGGIITDLDMEGGSAAGRIWTGGIITDPSVEGVAPAGRIWTGGMITDPSVGRTMVDRTMTDRTMTDRTMTDWGMSGGGGRKWLTGRELSGSAVLEVVLLIACAVGLVLIFKTQLTTLLSTVFSQIESTASSIY